MQLMKRYHNIIKKTYNSFEEAIKIYNAFDDGNYDLDAKKYGVVCFTLI